MRATYAAEKTLFPPRIPVSDGASIPAPIGGWDAISPLANMPPTNAVRLINWFPQPGYIELRRGYDLHVDVGTDAPVETLAAYQGVSSNALFAASSGKIFNITSGTASTAVSGLGNARFQSINFSTSGGNFLYLVNGTDAPQYYNGTAWAVAAITGISSSDIIHVNAHKKRLWFVLNGSTDAAYLPIDSIQGAAVKFPLGGLFTRGGYLMAMATWSLDGGNGPDDYAVFISSQGQVAVYAGTNPATDFTLVGVFDMGPPIGRRCFEKVGSDIAVVCIDGVVPLSKSLIFDRAAVANISITQKIQRVMNASARLYKDNFGWQLISYPRGTRAILNVPVSESSEQQQYVMNTLTGAWCQFTGMNANCWETYLDDLYFGDNEGRVFQADKGGTDFGETLSADMMTAYNYFNLKGNQKRWSMCRPQITTDSQTSVRLGFNVDFQDNAPIVTPSSPAALGSLWDTAIWDTDDWGGEITTQSSWTSVTGLGYCASIRVVVNVLPTFTADDAWGTGLWGFDKWKPASGSEVTLQINSFDLVYEKGSIV